MLCINLRGYLVGLSEKVPLNKAGTMERYKRVQRCYSGNYFPCLQQRGPFWWFSGAEGRVKRYDREGNGGKKENTDVVIIVNTVLYILGAWQYCG